MLRIHPDEAADYLGRALRVAPALEIKVLRPSAVDAAEDLRVDAEQLWHLRLHGPGLDDAGVVSGHGHYRLHEVELQYPQSDGQRQELRMKAMRRTRTWFVCCA